MFKRPNLNEDDDTLLRQQDEFMKSKNPSNAGKNAKFDGTRSKSRFARQKNKSDSEKTVSHDEERKLFSILKPIVEKNVRDKVVLAPLSNSGKAFPEVFVRDKSLNSGNADNSKKSIFLQHLEKEGQCKTVKKNSEKIEGVNTGIFGSGSYILDGSAVSGIEVESIHRENVVRLSEMTEDQIRDEQKKLLKMVDPNIVEFLRNRRLAKVEGKLHPPLKNVAEVSTEMEIVEDSGSKLEEMGERDEVMESADKEEENFTESQFVHMDKIEEEKVEWIGELPPLKETKLTGYNARFDLKGKLLPHNSDTPVSLGLHHHGNEPERPGYSFDELLLLARSTNIQQKILGFNVLSCIFKDFHKGVYDGCFNECILKELLDSGVLVILRLALDDNRRSVVEAAMESLATFICNPVDEICLDSTLEWTQGLMQPSLPTEIHSNMKDKNEYLKEKDELNDADIVQLDVIEALLRMDFLLRVRYLLGVLKPSPKVVNYCLDVLIRMARHSLNTAGEIANYKSLMRVVSDNFMPMELNIDKADKTDSAYFKPLSRAIKLFRVLCCWGRGIAATIWDSYSLDNKIMAYISLNPSGYKSILSELSNVSIESYRLWKVFLSYGLGVSLYLDFYPLLMKQLQFYETRVSLNPSEDTGESYNFIHGACMTSVLQSVVSVAATHRSLCSRQYNSEEGRTENYAPPLVDWSHVEGLRVILERCLQKWLEQSKVNLELQNLYKFRIISSCLQFLTNYYTKLLKQSSYVPVEFNMHLKDLFQTSIKPFLKGACFRELSSFILKHTSFVHVEDGKKRYPNNLSAVGAVCFKGDLHPILQEKSPFKFLTSLVHFIFTCGTINREIFLDAEFMALIEENQSLRSYLLKIGQWQQDSFSLNFNWFTRYETIFIYYLTKLYALNLQDEFIHNISLRCCLMLQTGIEFLLLDLFTQIIFNGTHLNSNVVLSDRVLALKLSDDDAKFPLLDTKKDLDSIWSTYSQSLFPSNKQIERSDVFISEVPHKLLSVTQPNSGESVIPADWYFMPIIMLYNKSKNKSGKVVMSNASSNVEMTMVKNSLKWMVFSIMYHSRIPMPTEIFFSRLSLVFLAKEDLFLDDDIRDLLIFCIRSIIKNSTVVNVDRSIPGITSYFDMYQELIEQYLSVSYGNFVFASFLMIPLQMSFEKKYRHLLWKEQINVLPIITVSEENLLLPLEGFLSPPESDLTLLHQYFEVLLSEFITCKRNPFLYKVALSHVSNFLMKSNLNDDEAKLKNFMLNSIKKGKDSQFINDLTFL